MDLARDRRRDEEPLRGDERAEASQEHAATIGEEEEDDAGPDERAPISAVPRSSMRLNVERGNNRRRSP